MTLLALACAIAALAAIPSAAGAFGVSGFSYTNSTLQAAGHPNTTISFNRTGSESEDLRDIHLDLPTGVFANPESATTKCTTTQFNADQCPTVSKVGTITAGIRALSTLNISVPGTINVLTPDSNQTATLGLTLRPSKICILFVFCAQPNKIFLKTGITVRTFNDSGLRTYTPGQPSSAVIGIPLVFVTPTINGDLTINSISLSFQSKANSTNSGPYFWFQTGSCSLATASLSLVSYQNVTTPTVTSSYTPTGCTSVPFAPTTGFTPSTTTAGAAGPVSYSLTIPDADATIQNSLPSYVDVDFPNGSGLDLNALSGITACTEDQLKASACPSSSIMGTATASSKFLPAVSGTGPGLTGNIYAMGVGNQIPVGVQLLGPRGTIIIFRGTLGTRGDANVGTGHVYATFDKIPQVPFNNFTLNIAKPVYKNPDTCAAQTVTSKLTGFSGATATKTNSYTTNNCAAAPTTTITSGPPSTTSNRQPTFTFTSSITTPAPTFQCKFDTGAFSLCSSPYTTPAPLADGAHTFSVQAYNGLTGGNVATYAFTVSTSTFAFSPAPVITPSTTQAAAHPNLAATVNITGGQPKSVSIKLPAGFNASLTSVPRCAVADAAAGNCAATSKVGTLQITANTFSGSTSGVGDVFLTDAPTSSDAGGLAVKVPLAGGTFIAQGGAYLVNNGNNQNLEIRNFPTAINGTDITITQLVMNLSGANRFLTNPSNCTAADGFTINSTAFSGATAAPVNVAFQATNCAAVPFSAAFNIGLSSTQASTLTGLTADLDVPVDNSTVKTLRVTLPPSLGPNFPSFGATADQCPSAAAATPTSVFDPSQCPAQSKVGTMTITTPLLPTPLTGDVYLINKSPLPWFGVKFDQPGISVRLVGVTSTPQVDSTCDPATDPNGFCQTQISAIFNNLPDVSLTHVNFNLNGPARTGTAGSLPGQLLVVASPGDSACATGPASTVVTPHRGTPAATLTQTISVTGC